MFKIFPEMWYFCNNKKKTDIYHENKQQIVIQNDNEDIKKFKVKVRNYCSKFLEREMIPSFITIEKDISLSSSGKIKRNE